MSTFSPWMPNIVPKTEDELRLAALKEQDPSSLYLMSNPLQKAIVETEKVSSVSRPQPAPMPTMPQQSNLNPAAQKAMDLKDLISQHYQKTMTDRSSRVDDLNNQMKGLGNEPTGLAAVDLSPFAALVDSWTGSNLRAGYNGPIAKNEYKEKQKAIQAALDKERGALSDDQLNYLKMLQAERDGRDMVEAMKQRRFEENRNLRQDERLERDVQALDKRMGDMFPGIITNLQKLTDSVNSNPNDIAGVGPGASALPDFLLTEAGSYNRQLARGLVGDLIKLQSGTAATDTEVSRKLDELGMGFNSKPSSFKRGLNNLKDKLMDEINQRQSGFRPVVVDTFKTRGGMTTDTLSKINTPSGTPEDAKKKRLEELRKKAQGG